MLRDKSPDLGSELVISTGQDQGSAEGINVGMRCLQPKTSVNVSARLGHPPRFKVSPAPSQIPTNTKVKGQQGLPKKPYSMYLRVSSKPPLVKGIPLQPRSQNNPQEGFPFFLACS